jgi:hypothetical protein
MMKRPKYPFSAFFKFFDLKGNAVIFIILFKKINDIKALIIVIKLNPGIDLAKGSSPGLHGLTRVNLNQPRKI